MRLPVARRVSTRARVSVALKADATLRLGVVADTHSAPNASGLMHLAALRPDVILHAGDIGDLSVLKHLAEVAPVQAVRGNIDGQVAEVPDVLTIDLTNGDASVLTLFMLHIAVNGQRLRPDVVRRAKAVGARLVVCGHSHVPFIGRDDGVTVFNPGSIGPKRFTLPILFGCIDIAPTGVTLRHVDALTGDAWLPPR